MSGDEITKPDNLIVHVNGDRWATEEHRTALLAWCIVRQGAPYVYGAKGDPFHGTGPSCYDCSGFCTCGMLAIGLPDWRHTRRAKDLFELLEPTDDPQPLDLCFYGMPEVDHVMFLWHDGRVYGACGRGSTSSPELAAVQGARVRFRPRVDYRDDFRGYRKLPTPKELSNG